MSIAKEISEVQNCRKLQAVLLLFSHCTQRGQGQKLQNSELEIVLSIAHETFRSASEVRSHLLSSESDNSDDVDDIVTVAALKHKSR